MAIVRFRRGSWVVNFGGVQERRRVKTYRTKREAEAARDKYNAEQQQARSPQVDPFIRLEG